MGVKIGPKIEHSPETRPTGSEFYCVKGFGFSYYRMDCPKVIVEAQVLLSYGEPEEVVKHIKQYEHQILKQLELEGVDIVITDCVLLIRHALLFLSESDPVTIAVPAGLNANNQHTTIDKFILYVRTKLRLKESNKILSMTYIQ